MGKRVYLIEIEITEKFEMCGYKPHARIIIPVVSNNSYNAMEKFINKYCGSEYPNYDVKSINWCDNGLFQPML